MEQINIEQEIKLLLAAIVKHKKEVVTITERLDELFELAITAQTDAEGETLQ